MQVNSALVILGAAQESETPQLQLANKSAFEISETVSSETAESTETEGKPGAAISHRELLEQSLSKESADRIIKSIQDHEDRINGVNHLLGDDKSLQYPADAIEDSRLVSEGRFGIAKGPLEGTELVVRDAVMGDRQGALMNAYHHGTDLLKANEEIEARSAHFASRNAEIASLKEQLAAGEGDSDYNGRKLAYLEENNWFYAEQLEESKIDADRAMASLSRLFSQTDNGLEGSVSATPTSGGFEITHGTYGKMMEVSDDGSITMFDSEGNGYSREEFVEKQPDGMIGEMHNDFIREEDQRLRTRERNERTEKIRNGEIEGSWVLELPDDYYI